MRAKFQLQRARLAAVTGGNRKNTSGQTRCAISTHSARRFRTPLLQRVANLLGYNILKFGRAKPRQSGATIIRDVFFAIFSKSMEIENLGFGRMAVIPYIGATLKKIFRVW